MPVPADALDLTAQRAAAADSMALLRAEVAGYFRP